MGRRLDVAESVWEGSRPQLLFNQLIHYLSDVLALFSGNPFHSALQPRIKVDRQAQLRSFSVKLSPHGFGEIIFSSHSHSGNSLPT
jgi:hypothetical protein